MVKEFVSEKNIGKKIGWNFLRTKMADNLITQRLS